jgi:pyruvate dehydrogenase E1 component beta subunit
VKMHMVQAINNALDLAMQQDNTIVLLGEDVGVDGGVFRVTDGLQAKYGKDRVVDTPLAEAGIIGTSIGLAINGMKPVPEMQFSGFSYQAFHHFKQHMARFNQRSNGAINLPMVVRMPTVGGIRALEHHSESPENFFVHCQGLKVVIPSNPYDAKGLMLSALKDPDPVIFLEPKKVYRSFKVDVPEEAYEVPLGDANIVKEGKDLTIITWGAMVQVSQKAAEELAQEGVDVEIIDLRSLVPLDTDKMLQSAKKTSRVVVVSEESKTGSFASEIVARIQEKAILHLNAPIKRVASFDVPFPQFAIESYFIPNVARVKKAVKETMEY